MLFYTKTRIILFFCLKGKGKFYNQRKMDRIVQKRIVSHFQTKTKQQLSDWIPVLFLGKRNL